MITHLNLPTPVTVYLSPDELNTAAKLGLLAALHNETRQNQPPQLQRYGGEIAAKFGQVWKGAAS